MVVQLAPAFAPVHVANIKALARGKYWDGATVYRVQDNYVAQWGLNESDKPWPAGVTAKPPAEYTRPLKGLQITPLGSPDPYAPGAGFADGWPVAYNRQGRLGRPHPLLRQRRRRPRPVARHRNRRRALCGDRPCARASSTAYRAGRPGGRRHRPAQHAAARDRGARLLQGQGAICADRQHPHRERHAGGRAPVIRSDGHGERDLRAAICKIRANRHDDFYIRPAGGVDLCNVQVPVRKKA